VGEMDRKVLRMAVKNSSTPVKHRVIPAGVLSTFQLRLAKLQDAIKEIYKREKEEKEVRFIYLLKFLFFLIFLIFLMFLSMEPLLSVEKTNEMINRLLFYFLILFWDFFYLSNLSWLKPKWKSQKQKI